MRTALLLFCSLVGLAVGKEVFDDRKNPFSRRMSDFINSLNTTWQSSLFREFAKCGFGGPFSRQRSLQFVMAGPNFHSSVRVGYIRGLMGEHPNSSEHRLEEVVHGNFSEELPESFDARQHWPHCDSIGLIRDQSSCGACWAFSAVSAMSDRICIHSKGKIQVNISAEDLLTCCDMCSFGCFGGNSSWAWRYWRETGIVSGGLYGTQDGCKPYTLPPCDHHVEGPLPKCGEFLPTPKCVNACRDGYDRDYHHDRFYGKEVYSIGKNEKQIRVEILKNGPLQAVMLAYEDFLHYKTGVYKHVSGKLLAGHAVKIIGWGTEKGTPYWLVANSWNTHWGDKGYFKILRGSNECNIEGQIHAGIPKF